MALGTLAQCSFNTACDTCVTASCDWCPDAAVCVPQNTDINCRAQCNDVFSVEKDLQKVYDTLKDKVQLIGPSCRDSFGSIGYSGCRWWFRRSTADLHWCHDWLRVRSFASVLVVRSSSDGIRQFLLQMYRGPRQGEGPWPVKEMTGLFYSLMHVSKYLTWVGALNA